MDQNSPIVEANGVSSPSSSGAIRASASVLVGVQPDPRWPSKFRWSAVPISSPLANTLPEPIAVAATSSSAAPSQSLTTLEIQGQSPPECAVSALVLHPVSANLTSPLPDVVITPPPVTSNEARAESELPSPLSVLEAEVNDSAPPSNNLPAIQGAWAQPPTFTSSSSLPAPKLWPSLSESHNMQGKGNVPIRKSFNAVVQKKPPDRKEDDLRFPWAARLNSTSRNLYRATEPEYLDDGTPKVTIPSHVLRLGVENQKEYVLGQFYRCSPPPGGLIHAVVNRIWGRKCRIFVRSLGDSKYLFHIPDASTRVWILQRGLWHIDDCLMFVAPWTPTTSLALPDISTVPVWLTLKNIPYLCYSIPGISHIASGLSAPIATHKPRLDPTLMGEAKILVEVELSKAFPPRIAVDDKHGCISMVDVEYAWIPTKCGKCGQLGHKISRCLQTSQQGKAKEVVSGSIGSQVEVVASDFTVVVPLVSLSESVENSQDLVVTAQDTIVRASDNQKSAHSTITTVKETFASSPITQIVGSIAPLVGNEVLIETQNVENMKISDAPVEIAFGDNRFSALGSSEMEEDAHESDEESDMLDVLTPSGQRILRDRPVKPSTKAKEMETSSKAGGRRGRGRGKRGGRG